jgi:hypothetical protein
VKIVISLLEFKRHKFIWFYKQDQGISEGEAAWIDI